MTRQWLDVDRAGLGKPAEPHGKGRLVGELIQNALDEVNVTRMDVVLALVPGRPLTDLTVVDDSPEGYRDLAPACTLFAESYQRTNPEQRGQFNFGKTSCWLFAKQPASPRPGAPPSLTPRRADSFRSCQSGSAASS
jgi:hypothetical protein